MRYVGELLELGEPDALDRALGELFYLEESAQSSSIATASPGTTYLSGTTRILPVGSYLLTATCAYAHANANRDIYVELVLDGSIVRQLRDRISAGGINYALPATLRKRIEITEGGLTHDVSLRFYSSGGTSYMQNAEITLERML
jgi:hypothetical protein